MQGLVNKLADLLIEKDIKLVSAESCTGGLLSATITHRAGASKIFERGYVTYSNEAKIEILNVSPLTLDQYGAVSAEVAKEMAFGALQKSCADLSVSITGIAGPDGGSEEKPVGLVYFGYALKGGSNGSLEKHFEGERQEIQVQSTITALKHLISVLEEDDES